MSKHSHTHSHGLYPKHTHNHCCDPCPPMCPPPCPPPCPPSNWCLPGEKGPKGDQGPRGYPGKDGAGCATKCCRFDNAAELEKCKTTLTPDVTSQEGQADRAALEKTISTMPAGCDAGFILMTKCGTELAHFCYVCDGMNAKPLPQYRSGVFTYGAINPYALVYNKAAGSAARFSPSGYLSPGDDKFLSRDMTYCVIPYKNGAEVKGFSWNWIGVKGMTVYFNLVAVVCKPNGKQMLEVYGPNVQGENNTAVKLTGNKNTYYAVNNNCGCQDLNLKLSCATTLGIVIRGIKKTPAAATVTNSLTNSASQCPPALTSTLVSNIVLENIDKIDSLQPSPTPSVTTETYQTNGTFNSVADNTNTWKITNVFPVIEVDQPGTSGEYYTHVQLEKVDENDNDVYDGYISKTGDAELFSFTDALKTNVGDAMKVNGIVHIFDNANYPAAAVAPSSRTGNRFLRNLFMSVEYCQLNNASALPHQAASTGTPTVSPVIQPTKKVWTELRGKDIVTVKDTILKERADIAAHLNFVYVPTNSGDTEASVAITPKAHDVIIYTNGNNDSGIALASAKLAPTLF